MKLYIILNKALDAGLKMAQACHALRTFIDEYPEQDQDWHANSNNIVVLHHEDLPGEAERLERLGLGLSRFHEPDLDDELTAICVEPNDGRHLSNLQLAS